MLSMKPKIAPTNILKDILPPMAISVHFDRYRKIIVLNLLRYFTELDVSRHVCECLGLAMSMSRLGP